MMTRMVEENASPMEVLAKEAKSGLHATMRIVRRQSGKASDAGGSNPPLIGVIPRMLPRPPQGR